MDKNLDEKVILIGEEYTIKSIMNTFFDTSKYIINCYSDQIDSDIIFDNFEIKTINDDFFNFDGLIVLSTSEDYDSYKKYICEMYGIDENRIVYANKWLLDKLKKRVLIIKPSNIRLELCTLCQLNCKDCYMRKNNSGVVGKGYLTFENFKKFVTKNNYIKEIEVSNSGEIFLNPDLEKILKYSYENNIIITMNNGVNLNTVSDSVLEALVKYKVQYITVSIDGATPEVYAYYRRNGNLNKVLENIKKINEFKNKYNSKYPILTWQYILMNHNIEEADLARKMAYENGMSIFYKMDWESNYDSDKIETVSNLVGFDITTVNYSGCRDLIFSPQINWDGRLLGCCFLYWDDWGVNVFENDLIDTINNNPGYKSVIYQFLGDKPDLNIKIPCGECEIRPVNV